MQRVFSTLLKHRELQVQNTTANLIKQGGM